MCAATTWATSSACRRGEMALSPKLELRHSQSLVMTPQLMQAIKLLQLSNLDLVAYVDAELERNPLLERDESDKDQGEALADDYDGAAAANGEGQSEWLEPGLDAAPDGAAEKLDTDLGNVFPDDSPRAPDEAAPTLPGDSWSTAPSRQAIST